jgi:AcrR family transcriptional regulator
MGKAAATKAAIVARALQRASVVGLSGLTIGELAQALSLSKSGLFAHFGSKEALQQAVLDEANARLQAETIKPAMAAPPGTVRLRRFFEHWLGWPKAAGLPGGCPISAACFELDDEPGPLRDHLAEQQKQFLAMIAGMAAQAVVAGQLRRDTDIEGLAFRIYALGFGHGIVERLLGREQAAAQTLRSFDALIQAHSPS